MGVAVWQQLVAVGVAAAALITFILWAVGEAAEG
jgi:hypothetical protein